MHGPLKIAQKIFLASHTSFAGTETAGNDVTRCVPKGLKGWNEKLYKNVKCN